MREPPISISGIFYFEKRSERFGVAAAKVSQIISIQSKLLWILEIHLVAEIEAPSRNGAILANLNQVLRETLASSLALDE